MAPPTIQAAPSACSSAVRAAAIEGAAASASSSERVHSTTSRGTRCEIPQVTS